MFQIGDRVAFSAEWLVNTGQQAGEVGHWRGKVENIHPLGERKLVVVRWDHGYVSQALDVNLAHVGPNMKFCKC